MPVSDFVLVFVVVVAVYGTPSSALPRLSPLRAYAKNHRLTFEPIEHLDSAWQDFKAKHDKEYNSEKEESRRKEIFAENWKKIQIHNYLFSKGIKTFTLGINEYSDMAHDEFISKMNGYRRHSNRTRQGASTYLSPAVPLTLSDTVDWRDKGYVTPVKNQGQCGSCWSFSTTGSLEGQNFRKTGTLTSLSEQNLVDCSTDNKGCDGGVVDYAFQYIKDNNGIDTEDSYPYTAQQGSCQFDPGNVGATVTGFTDIPQGDEAKLMEAVATIGPISVAIDASHDSFQQYTGGIYDEPECSASNIDHAVLVVGYGTQDGADYWLVKNSWGTSWGDNGYIYMSRNKDNQCGIASAASYPLV